MGPGIFCRIVAGSSPGGVIHEDDGSITLLRIAPVNPRHVLVLPNRPAPFLADQAGFRRPPVHADDAGRGGNLRL